MLSIFISSTFNFFFQGESKQCFSLLCQRLRFDSSKLINGQKYVDQIRKMKKIERYNYKMPLRLNFF